MRTRGCLVVVDDSTPEQMPNVGGQRINLSFFPVKCQGKELLLGNPKILVEFAFELSGLFLQPFGSLRIVPEFPGEARTTTLRVIDIPLDFAGGDWLGCQSAIGKGNSVPRVFPALILESGLFIPALVLNVAVTVPIAISIDPSQRCPGLRFEFPNQVVPSGPAFEFVEQDEKKRRGIR